MRCAAINGVGLALALLVLLFSGCQEAAQTAGSGSKAAQQLTRSAQFALPQSWPMGQITPPEGALKARRPYPVEEGYGDEYQVSGSPFNSGSDHAGRMWSVGFSYKKGVNAAMRHFDRCVKPMDWRLYYDQPATREYISPDSQYITQLHWDGDENVYMLSIFVYDKALEGVQYDGA